MRLTRSPDRQPPETIVALIDVVFFLLVFFMLIGRMDATAPFEVSPPIAVTGADMPSGGITVSVSADGQVAIDGLQFADPEIETEIQRRLAQNEDSLVRINAHKSTEVRHVLSLVDRLETLGAEDVVLVVTPEADLPDQ